MEREIQNKSDHKNGCRLTWVATHAVLGKVILMLLKPKAIATSSTMSHA